MQSDTDSNSGGMIMAAVENEDDDDNDIIIMNVYYAVEIHMKNENGVDEHGHTIASDEVGDYDYGGEGEENSNGRMNRNDVEASITQVMNGLARADLSGCTELESHVRRNRILKGDRENFVNGNVDVNVNVNHHRINLESASMGTGRTITTPRSHRNYGRILEN
eukprot:110077_1